MMGIKYLTEEHLKGFERYKYNCIDTNILSIYVMHPFWNQCVKLFPMWIAPNLITFVGFLLTVINFLLIGYYDWDFKAANYDINTIPRWVWFIAFVNIFSYYTLDGIDGKQARRTGTSGPLGELFDHGLDSFTTGLIPIYMFSLFGTDDLPPLRMYFILWNVYINFYLAHVEKYNTGVMYLPWGYDFTMWGVLIVLILTCICGPELWKFRLPYDYSCANLFEFILYVSGLVTNYPFVVLNIHKSYKNRTGKMRPFMEALRPLFPFFWLFLISLIWVLFSKNNILNLETRIFFVLLGTIFSNFASRLIVAQMTDTRTDGFNVLMWPLCLVVAISCFPFYKELGLPDISIQFEKLLLYILTSAVTIAHVHYGQGIVREMCEYFHIKCFKVRNMISLNNNDSVNSNIVIKFKKQLE